jgi:predicted transcriptional regulator of viral defense system
VATSTKPKQSLVGIELVRLLAYEGERIFTTDRARELAPRVGLKDSYVSESLYHLRRNNWIVPLRRGLYALSTTVPGVAAAHEFEIAMALVEPAAISHWSALHHHGLTEQVPRDVFVLTTKGTWIPRSRESRQAQASGLYTVGDTTYRFVQVKRDRFFGHEKVWIGDARVFVTDLERTLLDGLAMPQHCGDFSEVLHAFEAASGRLNVERITEYGIRLGATTAKRLGWVLETQGITPSKLDPLAALPIKGYRKLDPTGPRKGPCDSRWMVQENLPGLVIV